MGSQGLCSPGQNQRREKLKESSTRDGLDEGWDLPENCCAPSSHSRAVPHCSMLDYEKEDQGRMRVSSSQDMMAEARISPWTKDMKSQGSIESVMNCGMGSTKAPSAYLADS